MLQYLEWSIVGRLEGTTSCVMSYKTWVENVSLLLAWVFCGDGVHGGWACSLYINTCNHVLLSGHHKPVQLWSISHLLSMLYILWVVPAVEPLATWLNSVGFQGCFQLTVEAFYKNVCTRMIYAIVLHIFDPRRMNSGCIRSDSHWLPHSVVIVDGTPNLECNQTRMLMQLLQLWY